MRCFRFGSRAVWRLLPILSLMLGACIARTSTTSRTSEASAPVPDPDVDRSRAYLPLSEIHPPAAKPQRPTSLKPLSERSVKQMASARTLMHQQRYTEAAIELERALRYDPNHPEIHRTLGVLHWQAGNLQRAKTHTEQALRLNPDDAGAHFIMGRCDARDGDHVGAITALSTALACADLDQLPEITILCHYHLAVALAAEEYLTAALAQYAAFEDKAVAMETPAGEPELVTLLRATGGSAGEAKSRLLERLGRYADAADALEPLATADPANTAQGIRYARLLMRAGETKRALAAVEAIESDDEQVIQLLTEIYERLGQPDRVVDDLRSRIARRPAEPRLVLSLADRLVSLNRHGEATAELQKHLQSQPEAEGVRARLVELYVARKAWNDVLETSAEGIRRDPSRITEIESRFLQLAKNEEAFRQIVSSSNRASEAESAANPLVIYLRGVLALAADRIEQAEARLTEFLSRQPDFVPARAALAGLYLRTYRYDEAIQAAARAEEDVPESARLERILGRVHERLDDLSRAELHFKAAIQLDRTDADSMFALAKIYQRSQRLLQAQRQLRVLLEEDPLHEPAREMLAFSHLREGKIDVAYEQFEELKRLATTPITRARCEALLDPFPPRDAEAYRQALIEALERHGADAGTWIDIAETYNELTQPEQMREAYQKALAIDAENEKAALGRIRVDQRLLAFEEAIERLSRLLPKRPNRHDWRDKMIDLYVATQDHDAALRLINTQRERDDLDEPTRRRYRLRMLELLWLADRPDQVIRQLKSWSQAAPDDWSWAARLAGAYIQTGEVTKAVPILEDRFEADPADRTALSALTETLVAAGRFERARQLVLEWLHDDPENDEAMALLASVLSKTDRTNDTLELLRNKLLHTFNREAFQDRVITLLRDSGRHDEAIDYSETLLDVVLRAIGAAEDPEMGRLPEGPGNEEIAHYPDDPASLPALYERLGRLRLRLALGLIAMEEFRDAEEKLTSWLDLSRDPTTRFRYLRALTVCYQQQGRDEKANELLERTLLLEPGDVSLNNDLAYGWIDRGVRLDEAEPMIRYAVSRAPGQGAYLDTYGWLLYKKGDFEGAKKWLERARRALTRADPVILDHLGDVCWRLGLEKEALELWDAAVALVGEMSGEELASSDMRRVRDTTGQKVEDARAGRQPAVAPLAEPPLEEADAVTPSDANP